GLKTQSSGSKDNLQAYKTALQERKVKDFEEKIKAEALARLRAENAIASAAAPKKPVVSRRQSDQAMQPKPQRDAATAALIDGSDERRRSYHGFASKR
ncbi:MAG: hypothetical protein ABSF18_07095, partial [Gammaproteobacteria bacterium]